MTVPSLSDPSLWLPKLSRQLCLQLYWVWQHFLQKVSARNWPAPHLPGSGWRKQPQQELCLGSFLLKLVWARLFALDTGIPLAGPVMGQPAKSNVCRHSEEESSKHSSVTTMHPSLGKNPQHLPALCWGEVSDGRSPWAWVAPCLCPFLLHVSGPHHFHQARQKKRQGLALWKSSSSFLLRDIFFKETSSTRRIECGCKEVRF